MNISTAEYERKRHVFDLCRWVNDQLSEMEKLPDFDTIYFERKGENVKKLIEEAIPVACLGLSFFRSAHDVYITCLTGNQPYDAILEVKGWDNFEIKIEATTIETEQSAMRRQALSRDGFVWFDGSIRRKGKTIIATPELVDADKRNDKWIELAFERYLKKLGKDYGSDTAILISLSTHRNVPIDYRAKLVNKTRQQINRDKPDIHSVHYCYLREYIVDSIFPA